MLSNEKSSQNEVKNKMRPMVNQFVDQSYINKIDILIPILIEKYKIPGVAVSIIHNNSVELIKGYGFKDKKEKSAVETDTLFQVASISKTLTAWGVMKLVEANLIDLDKPISEYLTLKKSILPKDDIKKITIRSLLSHTSGLAQVKYFGIISKKRFYRFQKDFIHSYKNMKLLVSPQTKFIYTGTGYTLLQLIIEKVINNDFSYYMKHEILDPLGMHNSDYKQDLEGISKSYGIWGRALVRRYYPQLAAAGLYSSIDDLTKFIQANLETEVIKHCQKKVLKSESLELMHTRIDRTIPYGLGYYIRTLPDGIKILAHSGKNIGWNSHIAFLPALKMAIAIITNSNNGENLIQELMYIWLTALVNEIPDFYYDAVNLKQNNI